MAWTYEEKKTWTPEMVYGEPLPEAPEGYETVGFGYPKPVHPDRVFRIREHSRRPRLILRKRDDRICSLSP